MDCVVLVFESCIYWYVFIYIYKHCVWVLCLQLREVLKYFDKYGRKP